MIEDPRDAETLGEACDNGDGTYNLPRLLSWLSTTVSSKGISVGEVKALIQEVVDKRKQKEVTR